MHVNGIGSQNFNGLWDFFWSNYELGSRIDPDANPVGWWDEMKSLSSSSDSYTPSRSTTTSSPASDVPKVDTSDAHRRFREIVRKVRGKKAKGVASSISNLMHNIK